MSISIIEDIMGRKMLELYGTKRALRIWFRPLAIPYMRFDYGCVFFGAAFVGGMLMRVGVA